MINLVFLGLPFELYHTETVEYPYIMPEFVCQMRAFISEMTSYASILILTAFSVERWLAICFPMRFRGFSKFSRATKIIGAVWTMSVLCASPQVFLFRVTPLLYPSDFNHTSSSTETFIANTEYCDASEVYAHLHQAIINISFWLFFVIPMILVLGMYSHIGLCIRAANKRHLEDAESRKHHCNDPGKRKSVIKMLGG